MISEKERIAEGKKQAKEDELTEFCDKFELPPKEVIQLFERDQDRVDKIISHLLDKSLIPRTELSWASDNGANKLIEWYLKEHLYGPNDEGNNVKVDRDGVNYNVLWGIRTLHEYEPKRGRSNVPETTSRILKFKDGDQDVVQYYTDKLDAIIGSYVIICCVPSHKKDVWGDGLVETIKYLGTRRSRTSSPYLLRRNRTTQKRTQKGSDRTLDTNLDTIEGTNETAIADRPVVVIDDVTTSGNSMLACSELLWSAGCNCVGAIALSHTI